VRDNAAREECGEKVGGKVEKSAQLRELASPPFVTRLSGPCGSLLDSVVGGETGRPYSGEKDTVSQETMKIQQV